MQEDFNSGAPDPLKDVPADQAALIRDLTKVPVSKEVNAMRRILITALGNTPHARDAIDTFAKAVAFDAVQHTMEALCRWKPTLDDAKTDQEARTGQSDV